MESLCIARQNSNKESVLRVLRVHILADRIYLMMAVRMLRCSDAACPGQSLHPADAAYAAEVLGTLQSVIILHCYCTLKVDSTVLR